MSGRFAGGTNEQLVRDWCAGQSVGAGPIAVVDSAEVVEVVRSVAASKSYRDNAVLATMKVLESTGAVLR